MTLGAFFASWFMLVAVIPMHVAAMAGSHAVFLIFNANEGCYDLVMDHCSDADEAHIADVEEHDLHFFHNSCCYDEYVVKFKNHDIDHDLTIQQPIFELQEFSFQPATQLEYSEHNLPPPATLDVLRVTRLLI